MEGTTSLRVSSEVAGGGGTSSQSLRFTTTSPHRDNFLESAGECLEEIRGWPSSLAVVQPRKPRAMIGFPEGCR